jgi:hypothetical protein
MANKLNWSKSRDRRLMRERGVDPIHGAADAAAVRAAGQSRAPRKRPTKEELSAQAEAAFRQWNSRNRGVVRLGRGTGVQQKQGGLRRRASQTGEG